ncbi:class F sortase [Terrabacter sp. NPDC080008]|uniref:class F sortase n=1 Tax=Terrabacter sp. NPDC080008 TaxID=3155176 RepID=UPI00344DB38D
MGRHAAPRERRAARWLVLLLAAALVGTGLWLVLPRLRPGAAVAASTVPTLPDPALSAGPTGTAPSTRAAATAATTRRSASSPPTSAAPGATTSSARGTCRVGEPARLVIPTLGVDAPFEHIGLDPNGRRDATGQAPLGTPTDRTKAGWYAAGPRPGSGTGTVLIDGHTYRNGSAIFKDDFAHRIATGQLIQLRQDNGSTCSYRITNVWPTINSATDYPKLVASQHLYDFTGPERLLLATCGGTWNPTIDNYDDINVVLAIPVVQSH